MERTKKLEKILKKRGVEILPLVLDSSDFFTQLHLLDEKYKKHPAHEELTYLFKQLRDNPREGLVGVASGKVDSFFHWGPKDQKIIVFAYNENSYRNKVEQILFIDECYGRAVLECYPELKQKLSLSKSMMTNRALYRLFAKFFAVSLFVAENGRSVLNSLLKDQSKKVFQRVLGYDPKHDVFLMFADRLISYFNKNLEKVPTSGRILDRLVHDMYDLVHVVDIKHVVRWRSFCECAQDMIWRNASPRDVLMAAIIGSESVYFQSIGRTLAKYTGVKVDEAVEDNLHYNAFSSEEENAKRHEREIKETLGDALNRSLQNKDSKIFHQHARTQNEELLEGRFAGWCAKALQSTADLFDVLSRAGEDSEEEMKRKMRDNFMKELKRDDYEWHNLKEMTDEIVDHIKSGRAITHSMIQQIANDNNMKSVSDAIDRTSKSQSKKKALENAQNLENTPEAPKPQAPAVKMSAPRVAQAPSAPGMGGGRARRRVVPQETTISKDNTEHVETHKTLEDEYSD